MQLPHSNRLSKWLINSRWNSRALAISEMFIFTANCGTLKRKRSTYQILWILFLLGKVCRIGFRFCISRKEIKVSLLLSLCQTRKTRIGDPGFLKLHNIGWRFNPRFNCSGFTGCPTSWFWAWYTFMVFGLSKAKRNKSYTNLPSKQNRGWLKANPQSVASPLMEL